MIYSKSQLIAAVAIDTQSTKSHTEAVLKSIVAHIEASLLIGEEVRIPGFGTFSVKVAPARIGRNPRTGAALDIAAKAKPVFKPAADFAAKFN